MLRVLAAILTLLLAATLRAAEPQWLSNPDEALEAAARDGKMILVYYRVPGARVARADRTIAQMTADSTFAHALDSFVPLRIEAPAPSHPLVDAIGTTQEPLLVLLDASPIPLARFDVLAGWKTIAEDLLRFRAARDLSAESARRRRAGHIGAADFALGHVLRSTMRFEESAIAFERAAARFGSDGDLESEQLAQLAGAASRFAFGQQAPARAVVTKILGEPVSRAVEAEAQLTWGTLLEAYVVAERRRPAPEPRGPARRGTIPQAPRGHRERLGEFGYGPAIEAYRKAYVLAERDTSTELTARAALQRLDKAPLPDKTSAATGLRIVPPVRVTFSGIAEFLAEAPAETRRVDFLLDEEKVASKSGAPFRVKFDVGPTPRMRVVKARAYDAANQLLGEAMTTINDRADTFLVTIVNPAEESIEGRTEVEVDVKIPPGRTLRDVTVSWNGEQVATLTTPPLRAAIDARGGLAYLEAIATLDDGTTSATTRIYNARSAAKAAVSAVTVLATVSDAAGAPVRGLTANDFVLADQGTRVTPQLLSTDTDPVTIGLAIDSSSSMSGRQLYAIKAAVALLDQMLRPEDRAFVVAFDTRARLVHERSNDLASLRAAILGLMPTGGTSIFDGTTFALQQFQGIPGRKALVVVSDGMEGASSASARESERLARTVGVPIYLVIPPGGTNLGHALRELSQLTGGATYAAVPEKEFATTWSRLAEELRAQYVLQYEMPGETQSGTWRSIDLRVPHRDVRVRTVAGYRAN